MKPMLVLRRIAILVATPILKTRGAPHISLALIILSAACAFAQPAPGLKQLYEQKRYFELRDALRDYSGPQSVDLLFYRGAVSNKFNRARQSNAYLDSYLKQAGGDSDDALLIECYKLLGDNYRKTYQYRRAAAAYQTLLTRFGRTLEASDRADYENERKLWRALARVPPQRTTFDGDSMVRQDKDGHFPFEINQRKVALAFDSGANLSVLTNSLARRLALKVIDAPIEVVAIAGNKVKAGLAVAPRMRIGNVTVRHAVFLVLADKDLYITEANFQIDGLIGFPVIESLRQVTFVRGSGIVVPATPGRGGEQNLCLDGLTPLIAGWFEGARLSFALDTGATRSTLYPPFFKKYEAEVRAKYGTRAEKIIGVGGHREIKGYLAKDIAITFSGRQARYAQIPILTEYTNEDSRHFYGNLGQDLLQQFASMTLNFEAMSLAFE